MMSSGIPVPPVEYKMPEHDVTDTDARRETDNMSAIIQRIVMEGDQNRIQTLTSLLNVFNVAVQKQGGRVVWDVEDFRAFCISLAALDSINQRNLRTSRNLEQVEEDLKASLASRA